MLTPRIKLVLLVLCMVVSFGAFALGESENTIYSFPGGSGIGYPWGGLVADKSGNLYGVANGGTTTAAKCEGLGCGFVYELSPTADGGWQETTLYTFTGGWDGGMPVGNLAIDAKGNLYGVTEQGGKGPCSSVLGAGCGVVFRLSPKHKGGFAFRVIYAFQQSFANSDGNYPNAGVVFDQHGNLYGTVEFGGDFFCGCGIVYQLVPGKNGTWTENILYDFVGISRGGSDVSFPAGDVFVDANGNIFGTGSGGGDANCNDGCGGVFELALQSDGSYQEKVLHIFRGGRDGMSPMTGLVEDSKGNLYGNTEFGGGSSGCSNGSFGCGTLYELQATSSGYVEKTILRFDGEHGFAPYADLILGTNSDGAVQLYGTTLAGGSANDGVAFELAKVSGEWSENVLYAFQGGDDGALTEAPLLSDGNGGFFGTTRTAGASGAGTVFHLLP